MPSVVPSQVVKVIDKIFPFAEKQTESNEVSLDLQWSGELATILSLVESIPERLLVLEDTEYILFIASKECIRNAINTWQNQTDVRRAIPLCNVKGYGKKNPVAHIRSILSKCPDEYPDHKITILNFIDDVELREDMKIDLAIIEKSLSNEEWKSATVIAGSLIEALLLWVLSKIAKDKLLKAVDAILTRKVLHYKPSSELNDWNLNEYAQAARELKIINEDTHTNALLAKNYRNLIHPGRSYRLEQKCNRGTAYSAVGAVYHIINDLGIYYKQTIYETTS